MPQPRPPGNLKEQCVRNIIKNMDSYWCRDYIKNWLETSKNLMYVLGPFEGLPSSVIELMMENLNKSGKLRKHHLHLLLLHHLERLVLIRGTSNFGYILSLLPIRCKKLCHLGLKGKNLPHKQLNEAFISLNLLQTLDLSRTNVTDETLSVIASYCKHIRVLNLSDTEVTDRSIFSLCHGDKRVSISATDEPRTSISATEKCISETEKPSINASEKPDISKSLIKLDLHGTVVTFFGIQSALMNLPNLQVITHSLLLYAVAKLQMRREKMAEFVSEVGKTVSDIQPLKIRLLQSDEFGKGNVLVADAQLIRTAVNLCPNVQYVHLRDLSNVDADSLLPLFSLDNVIDLVLQFDEYEHVDFYTHIGPLLQRHGKTLHRLQLHSVQKINIDIIASLCTKLQTLELGGFNSYCTNDPAAGFKVPENVKANFRHLKSVKISHDPMFKSEKLTNFQMPSNCLKLILGSPLLEKIVLVEQSNFTDRILIDITNATKLHCLKTLSLTLCNNVTMRSLWNVVRLYNPLELLHLIDCRGISKSDYFALKRYFLKEKLQVEIEWA